MDDRVDLETALADVLERMDEGGAVDAVWLRANHPDHWRELAEVLALEGRLSGLAAAPERVGPYRILERLGDGGMGAVYLAADERPDRPGPERVALKILHPHLVGDPESFQRFLREAQVGTQVIHPNVVRTLDADVFEHDGTYLHVLVMEYVQGQTLRALLEELGSVSEQLCRQIGRDVARALVELHGRGIVHRDLKPENVLLTAGEAVRVMDLGVARQLTDDGRVSRTGAFVGSWAYAAPEQFRSDGVGSAADLYSLGLTLYELATGVHAFGEQDFADAARTRHAARPAPASDHSSQLSPFFEEVLRTLVEPEPRARFESAARLALVLERGEDSDWWKARESLLRSSRERPFRRILIQRETAFYGREREFAVLGEAFAAVTAGDGRAVVLEGEAGIGKSRLLDAFVQDLSARGPHFHFLYGSYPPGGVASAASAFLDAVLQFLGREAPEAALAPYFGDSPHLLERASGWLRGEAADASGDGLDEGVLRTLLNRVLRGLARDRPVVLAIDDLHFAPDEGRGLFSGLAHALGETPVLLLGTTRPDVPVAWKAEFARRHGSELLPVARLGGRELDELVDAALESFPVPPAVAREVVVKSDGNPFFVFEIVRGLRAGRFTSTPGEGEWLSPGEVSAVPVPDSVRGLVESRVAGLTAAERDLIEAASCCGNEFDGVLLGEALDLGRLAALRTLARIEARHRLVRSVGKLYRFDHHLVLETLYASLPDSLRQAYHEALAVTLEGRLEQRSPDGVAPEALAAEICRHFVRAARPERALPHSEAAFKYLEHGYRHAAALRLSEALLHEAVMLAGTRRMRVLLRRASLLEWLGRRDDERADLDEALALADESGEPAARCEVRTRLGQHLRGAAEYEAARDVLAEAMGLAREAGDLRLEGEAAGTFGAVLWNLGRYKESAVHLERFRKIAQETGDLQAEATANGHLGNLHHILGRQDAARRCFERRIELSRETGDLRGEATATGNLAVLASMRSDLARALELNRRNLELSRELGYQEGVAVGLVNVGAELLGLGVQDEAGRALEEALTLVRALGARRIEVYVLHALGVLAEHRGDLEGAERTYRETIALGDEIGHPSGAADRLLALGTLLTDTGRKEEARTTLRAAVERADASETPVEGVLARIQLARVCPETLEDAVTACAANRDALGLRQRMETSFFLFEITGRPEHLTLAREGLDELVLLAPAEHREAMLANVPLHRDILAAGRAVGAGE